MTVCTKYRKRSTENIDLNKTETSVKCIICNYYYFILDYQPYVCNACNDFSMNVKNLSDFFILNIKSVGFRVYITNIDKKDAVNILNNSNLGNKVVL